MATLIIGQIQMTKININQQTIVWFILGLGITSVVFIAGVSIAQMGVKWYQESWYLDQRQLLEQTYNEKFKAMNDRLSTFTGEKLPAE